MWTRLKTRRQPRQQTRSRAIQTPRIAADQARLNVLGQRLAQLDTPLVEAVDAPDRAADKHAVFLQGNQRAQTGGAEFIEQQKSAGAVASEMLVTTRIHFTQQQRLRLRQHVGQQQRVVAGQVMARSFDRHKLHRHHVAALVQHLEIGVLAVGAGLAPDHRRGAVGQGGTGCIHALAVALHLKLLQVGRVALERAVVGRHRAG